MYDFSNDKVVQRQSVHTKEHIDTDLSGIYSLVSDHFYYFGDKAIDVPISFNKLIHKGRGHKVINDEKLIDDFATWISGFKKNKIYGEPQYRHKYDRNYDQSLSACK